MIGRRAWFTLAAHEVTQDSAGFSPNDLVLIHMVWALLAVFQADWKNPPPEKLTDNVNGFKRWLYESVKMAKQNLEKNSRKNKATI